jgi:hypothetical protein
VVFWGEREGVLAVWAGEQGLGSVSGSVGQAGAADLVVGLHFMVRNGAAK